VRLARSARMGSAGRAVMATCAGLAVTCADQPGRRRASYVPISGRVDVSENASTVDLRRQQYGMRINYDGDGSTRSSGLHRAHRLRRHDIPFQTNPNDGSAPEDPRQQLRYMPITAGGTVFMYNLTIAANG